MSVHTPGKWTIVNEDYDDHIGYTEPEIVCEREDGEDVTIATIRIGLEGTDANARLFAAAPDLLAAARLQLAVDEHLRQCTRCCGVLKYQPCGEYFRLSAIASKALVDAVEKAEGKP